MTVVILTGPPPWGFRLSGGSDFRRALTVTKVNVSSKAELANLRVGDVIMEINGERTTGMLHVQARNNIKSSRPQLKLLIHSVVALSRELVCQNQIFASQGLEASRESNENYSKQQYSSTAPVQNILPTLTSIPTIPTMPSMNPVVRKTDYIPNNNKSCDVPRQRHLLLDSEVYQRIHGRRETPTDPRQSNTFHLIQEVLEEDCRNTALCTQEHPSTRPPSNPSLLRVQRFRTCESCGTLIVTQAIKIREGHHRHQECYTCRDCGLSLLKKGHFCVDKELYCGKHALQRYQRTG